MNDAFTNYMQAMHSLFNDEFMSVFEELEPKFRRRVLPYLQAIYRRWYHSTFIENVHFSPANIAATVGYYCDMPTDTHIAAGLTPPVSKMEKVDMKVLSYSVAAHPVVADLRQLIKMCTPYIDLCEEWCFVDTQAIKIAKKLSLYDPYYASFLLEVACKMGLLVRMPSLYVQRVQVAETAAATLGLPDAALFHQIVETVIEMTAAGLQGTLPGPVPLFTEEGLREMLLNPLTTDEILEQAFGALGYDLNQLSMSGAFVEGAADEFSEEAESIAELMSGIFVLGIMLDRLFFTPFGYFLRLIRPIYSIPINIEVEINQYIFALECMDDEFAAFFGPCTSYTLTDLGMELFNTAPTGRNYIDSRRVVPKEVVESAFESPLGIQLFVQAARDAIPVNDLPNAVYTFCVYDTSNPDAWVHIQIPKTFSLHHLYEEVIDAFYTDDGGVYSFFHGKAENPFVEYIGGLNAGKHGMKNKTFEKYTNVLLSALDFDHEGEMLLVVGGNSKKAAQKFAVEWLSVFAPNPMEHYPRVSKLSAASQKMLDEWGAEDFLNFDGFDFD